jgi:hypothetical protein
MEPREAQPNHRDANPPDEQRHERLAFKRVHHTHVSPIAHFLRTTTALSPLLLQEFVKDPEKRWRYARIAILGTTLVDQLVYAYNSNKQAHERERCHEKSWVERSRYSDDSGRGWSR